MIVLSDGWHQAIGIAVVVIIGVVVLRRPNDDMLLTGHVLIVLALSGVDAEQWQEVVVGGEDLTFLQDAVVVGRMVGCRAQEEKEEEEEEKEKGKPHPDPPP